MADVFQTQFRDETIAGFEQRNSHFRGAAVSEAMIKGNSAVFLVSDSGGATAVTRGANGLIPSRGGNQVQYTVTLKELHDKVRKTSYNIFASQGDQRRIMQDESIGVMNRTIDSLMVNELANATNDTGTAATASLSLFVKARAILGNLSVPITEMSNMFCAISPAAEAYLLQSTTFTSADYVDVKPLVGTAVPYYRWLGMYFFVSDQLPGLGTNAEKLFMWHRNALGWAANSQEASINAGYDEEDDYSYVRSTIYAAAKLLQNSGVVVINHDGSAFQPS